ncbi:MAG: F0F1 ATP synthase subunit A [Verrucomicrobiota bacterium]
MSSSFTALLSSFPVLAEAAVHGAVDVEPGAHAAPAVSHEVSAKAQTFFSDPHHWAGFLTNSIFVAALVTIVFLWFFRSAMKKAALVPGKKQNFVELIVEFLYNQVEGIVGPKIAPGAFPLLATIFIYVTVSNWVGLLPGVGTIGFSSHEAPGVMFGLTHIETPLLRPATADMNLTFGIAFASLIVWLFITIKEMGVGGTLYHIFGPKGEVKGFMKYPLILIFGLVGVIEVISILFRPMTLSLRLYGNVFAGENLLHTMGSLVHSGISWLDFICSVLVPLPFYFLEILVGVLQGMVFALLCAVFIKLSTTHDESHGEEEHAHH